MYENDIKREWIDLAKKKREEKRIQVLEYNSNNNKKLTKPEHDRETIAASNATLVNDLLWCCGTKRNLHKEAIYIDEPRYNKT